MITDTLKNELRILAEAQEAFELNGWKRVDAIQKDPQSNSTAYGTVYEKGGRRFYLNIKSADKARGFIDKSF